MTCIVALKDNNNKVYMGGDGLGVDTTYYVKCQIKNPKIFYKDGFLIGYTTSFRMGQILQYQFEIPKVSFLKDRWNLMEYMVTKFVPELIECFKSNYWLRGKEDQVEGGNFLVSFGNNIFLIESDFQVMEIAEDFNAVGCGRDYAWASLLTTQELKIENSIERIKLALDCASQFTFCGKPYTILDDNGEEY